MGFKENAAIKENGDILTPTINQMCWIIGDRWYTREGEGKKESELQGWDGRLVGEVEKVQGEMM